MKPWYYARKVSLGWPLLWSLIVLIIVSMVVGIHPSITAVLWQAVCLAHAIAWNESDRNWFRDKAEAERKERLRNWKIQR